MILTEKSIAKIKPCLKRREYPDDLLRGHYYVVQPSGATSWIVRYRFNARSRKLTLGPGSIGFVAARALARAALQRVAAGEDPQAVKMAARRAPKQHADRDLVAKVAAQFMARHVKTLAPQTQRSVARVMKNEIVAAFGDCRLSDIRRADVHELLDGIIDRGAPVYANRVLAWLKAMTTWAISRDILEVSPIITMKSPTAETARDRILSDSELKALWLASDSLELTYSGFVKLLVLLGQRRNEVSEMQWSEVDLDAAVWTLPAARTKNGREHIVPLSDLAVAILRALPRIDGSDFVLTVSGLGPVRGHSKLKQRLDRLMPPETQPWVLHDIRRTVASGMAKLGVQLPVIEKVLNHTSGSFAGIVGTYQRHSFATEKATALQTWARFVEALVTGEAGQNIVPLRLA